MSGRNEQGFREPPSSVGGPPCRRCGNTSHERLQRITFVQRHILPFFNLYPWRCAVCNKITYRTARNRAELLNQTDG